MNFDKLYNEALEMWPDNIDISDGQANEQGILFKNLSDIWHNIEAIAKERGEWYDLMTWIIFSNFHRAAKNSFLKGDYSINKENISSHDVKVDLIKNLKEPDYEDMLEAFFEKNPKV